MKQTISIGAGVAVGALLMYSSSFTNGQSVQIYDDGVHPVDDQRVLITEPQTVTAYDGTYGDLTAKIEQLNEQMASCSSSTQAEIDKYTALKESVDATVTKLPTRKTDGTPAIKVVK